nr:DNA methyltransferase [Bacteroides graminisolvens]
MGIHRIWEVLYKKKNTKKIWNWFFPALMVGKNLDYISCWFLLGSMYIQGSQSKCAFVSTNSVCQGEQVYLLWNPIFSLNIKIYFAHRSFKWNNNAKHNAGVTCVIIGLMSNNRDSKCILSSDEKYFLVNNITPYLIPSEKQTIVLKRSKSIYLVPTMDYGSKPTDGGNLLLNQQELKDFSADYPNAAIYIKPFVGSDDFINGKHRYCFWIEENQYSDAYAIFPIKERIEKVKLMRLNSKKRSYKKRCRKSFSICRM